MPNESRLIGVLLCHDMRDHGGICTRQQFSNCIIAWEQGNWIVLEPFREGTSVVTVIRSQDGAKIHA